MIHGIGCDLVRVERIRRLLDTNERFVTKVFTPTEILYCSSKADPAQSFAVRFAAKEALMKALGTGWSEGISWQEIEVVAKENGRPELKLSGHTKSLLERRGAFRIQVSLSHEKEFALAFVVLEQLEA